MATTLDQFFELASTAAKGMDSYSKAFRAYAAKLKSVQSLDPCEKGFDQQLAELDRLAEESNAISQQINPEIIAAQNAFNDLSFLDKRNASALAALNTLGNSLKGINALKNEVNKGGTRQELRERYNSCEEIKEPEEEEETDEDPGVKEDPEAENSAGENQADEDKGDESTGSGESANTSEKQTPKTPAGTTQAGKSGSQTAKKDPSPNKRLQNPLANLSSYTYNISLYMMTPDAYGAFIASGRKDINAINNVATVNAAEQVKNTGAGAYLLAQSGGINNSVDKRAPGFEVDYYIDNLRMLTNTNMKSTGTQSNTTEISFDIVEPFGFSFISNLNRARTEIMKNSKLPNAKEQTNALKQIYIIGIRFYGYDKNGKVATGKEHFAADSADPTGNSNGLFERFFDIKITNMKFKIDGKSTLYNITATNLPEQTAFTNTNGRINKDIQLQASTVFNALLGDSEQEIGLLTSLNRQQQKMKADKVIEIPNEYDIVFIGESADIKNASLILDSDKDKLKSAMVAQKSSTSTDEISVSASPSLGIKQIKFKNDTSILQAIGLIIGQSSYLYQAMNTVFTAKTEPDENGNDEENPGAKNRIRWYNLGAKIDVLGFDTKKCDWSYKITYVIQPYETPVILTPFANAAKPYYGPHKRYEYWYTGKNSEILRYEQQINNAFFTVALDSPPKADEGATENGGSAKIPSQPQMRTPEARQGVTGKGYEAQNTYLSSLKDPEAWARAKITILGDPDFLMNTSPDAIDRAYNPYYGSDSFTVNPNGGQVFIEINFIEPEDYGYKRVKNGGIYSYTSTGDGLLSLNESIQFVEVPKEIKDKVKGVSYMVLSVTSTFRGGRFEQELDLNINTWGDIVKKEESAASQREESNAGGGRGGDPRQFGAAGGATTSSGSTTQGDGLAAYEPPKQETASSENTDPPTAGEATPDAAQQDSANQETVPVQNKVNNPDIERKIEEYTNRNVALQTQLNQAKNAGIQAREQLTFVKNTDTLPIVIGGNTFDNKEAAVEYATRQLNAAKENYSNIANQWNDNIAEIEKLKSQLSSSTSTQSANVADDDRRG